MCYGIPRTKQSIRHSMDVNIRGISEQGQNSGAKLMEGRENKIKRVTHKWHKVSINPEMVTKNIEQHRKFKEDYD